MKTSHRIALMFSLSTVLLCGTALAADAITLPAAAPAKAEHHHKAKAMAKPVNSTKYQNCMKENMADAEYFCSAHPGASCQAEKDGAEKQCKSEARGERQKG